MENIVNSEVKLYQKKFSAMVETISLNFFRASKMGIYGFSLIFLLIFFGNLFTHLIGINRIFRMDIFDVLLSSVGFILQFLLYFTKKYASINK